VAGAVEQRGDRVLTGRVVSDGMDKTITVLVERLVRHLRQVPASQHQAAGARRSQLGACRRQGDDHSLPAAVATQVVAPAGGRRARGAVSDARIATEAMP